MPEGAPNPLVTDPPLFAPNVLHTTEITGQFSVYGPDGELKDDQSYACTPGDSIKATVTVGIHDSQPHDHLGDFTRSFVMQIQKGYTLVDAFQAQPEANYFGANNDLGEHSVVTDYPLLGHLAPIGFDQGELRPGVYVAWVCAVNHFLLNPPQSCLAWTPVCSITVFPCGGLNETQITTIPYPSDPEAGDEIYDTALLEGGAHPTGQLIYRLWDGPHPGAGTLVFQSIKDVTGNNGQYESDHTTAPDPVFHGHWEVDYTGDDNNQPAHSGSEPVDILSQDRNPTSSDTFTFMDKSDKPPDARAIYPGIARFRQTDAFELWFCRTDPASPGPQPTAGTFGQPLVYGDVLAGGKHGYVDVLTNAGAQSQLVLQIDDFERKMLNVMGLTVNQTTGEWFSALTPDELQDYTPHDICWLPNDTGLLVAVVTGVGALEFRRYDYDGNLVHTYATPATDAGWAKQAVKVDVTCNGKTAFYTDSMRTIFRYDLEHETQLPNYHTLGDGADFIYSAVRILAGGTHVVTAMSLGPGPRRAIALGKDNAVWVDDPSWVAAKRRLINGHVIFQVATIADPTPINDQSLSMAAWFKPCVLSQMMGHGEIV